MLFFSKLCLSIIFCQLARVVRWILFQVASVADFFSQVAPVADFYFRLCTSLTFSQVVQVVDFFFSLRTLLIFYRVPHVAFFRSHESFADFFFMLRLSLTFITGRARRWVLFWVAPIADFFFRLRTSLNFSQVRPVADFFPQVSHVAEIFTRYQGAQVRRWLLFQFAHIAEFFPGRALSWFCPRLHMSQIFFTDSDESIADFFFRLLPSLTFFTGQPCRWLLFQVAHTADFYPGRAVADFSPGYASRCFFPGRTSPSLTSFSGCAHRWLFTRLRTSLITFSWSHDSVADLLFRFCLSMTSFSQVAPVTIFFSKLLLSLFFFSKLCLSMNFAS